MVDNREELDAIEFFASKRGITQKILLRLTPGIDTHTYAAVNTGKVDSKFGSAIETGQADEITAYTLSLAHIKLAGYHCHIGSQVFDSDTFLRAAGIMLNFANQMREKYGLIIDELDLGGGYGVRYTENDPEIDIAANICEVAKTVKAQCTVLDYPMPAIRLEPGRSIVADAGMTLYTVGTVKKLEGFANYVSVDGGMTDNPRYTLYESPYTVVVANKADKEKNFTATIAGRCCESGDLIQENTEITEPEITFP